MCLEYDTFKHKCALNVASFTFKLECGVVSKKFFGQPKNIKFRGYQNKSYFPTKKQ